VARSFDDEAIPVGCDGCGRDAASAGMDQTGWTVRRDPQLFAGVYCRSCASALGLLGSAVECADCGRAVALRRAEAAGWRFYADAVGELHPYCPPCAVER
jgi:hypothetical protein